MFSGRAQVSPSGVSVFLSVLLSALRWCHCGVSR